MAAKNEKNTKVQDAKTDRPLKELLAQADLHEAIRQGLEDVGKGRTRPLTESLDEFRLAHRIPR